MKITDINSLINILKLNNVDELSESLCLSKTSISRYKNKKAFQKKYQDDLKFKKHVDILISIQFKKQDIANIEKMLANIKKIKSDKELFDVLKNKKSNLQTSLNSIRECINLCNSTMK